MLLKNKKPKLFTSTIFSFLIFVLIPTFVIFVLLSSLVRNEMIEQNTKIQINALDQLVYNIENEIKNASIMSSSIVHNENIIKEGLNFNNAVTRSENYSSRTKLDKLLEDYLVSSNFIGEIYLLFEQSNKFHVSRNLTCIDANLEKINQLIKDTDPLLDKTQIVDDLSYILWNKYPFSAAIVTYPSTLWGYDESFSAAITIAPLNSIKQLYNNENLQSNEIYFLINNDNKILAANKTEYINQDYMEESFINENIVIKQDIKNTPWTLVNIVDPNDITKNVDRVFTIIYLLLGILFILYLIYNVIFLLLITRPINNLINNMSKVGKGTYDIEKESSYFYEIDTLGYSFYSMVDELELLNHQIESAHQETLMREIEALRFQINPHFMCNTLNSIRMMAMISKNDAIKRMSTSLMVIMEDNLNGTTSFSSVEHELKNIESYIYIMQVRYGNSFIFEKDIESSTLECEIPSMLLQPLIENSILHGLRTKEINGKIKLVIKEKNNHLLIKIYDNGIGASKEKLEEIFTNANEHSKGFNHIGLMNVKRRLELLYKNKATIKIISREKAKEKDSFFLHIIKIPIN